MAAVVTFRLTCSRRMVDHLSLLCNVILHLSMLRLCPESLYSLEHPNASHIQLDELVVSHTIHAIQVLPKNVMKKKKKKKRKRKKLINIEKISETRGIQCEII